MSTKVSSARDEEVKRNLKSIIQENAISYRKLSSILSDIEKELLYEGKDLFSDEEMLEYEKFRESGNEKLHLALEGMALTSEFAYGIQTVKAMFDDVDFSKPFRIIIDYDPEQPRTIVKKYLTKEVPQSCSVLVKENQQD